MTCYLCGSENSKEILSKPAVPIWTNAAQGQAIERKYRCILRQCEACGHIYQPLSEELDAALNEIYSSHQAQLSTSMGKGNWGQERGRSFLETFLQSVDIKNCRSALEIGCAEGYILRFLSEQGVPALAGIEPSLEKGCTIDNILFLKDFANEALTLPQKYGLIYSVGVFEHIRDMNSIMRFCQNHLEPDGDLFFSVPNARKYLEEGDPALFTHEHVQYFTEDSAARLLSRHGFRMVKATKVRDSLNVLAKRTGDVQIAETDRESFDYQRRIDEALAKVERILKNGRVLVHGANNALNNILGWLNNASFDFTLVDNDSTKHGKTYFHRTVRSLDEIDLRDYDVVLIIPLTFYEAIEGDYLKRGFQGRLESLRVPSPSALTR